MRAPRWAYGDKLGGQAHAAIQMDLDLTRMAISAMVDGQIVTPGTGPVDIRGPVDWVAPHLTLPDLSISNAWGALHADLTLTTSNLAIEGQCHLTSDAARLLPLVNQTGTGQITAHAALSRHQSNQWASVTVAVTNLTMGTLGSDGLQLQASTTHLYSLRDLRLSARGRGVTLGATRLDHWQTDTEVSPTGGPFRVGLHGYALTNLSLSTDGVWARHEGTTTVTAHRADATWGPLTARLDRAASLRFGTGLIALEDWAIGVGEADIHVDALSTGGVITTTCVITNLDLQAIPGTPLTNLTGRLHARLDASIPAGAPHVSLRAAARDLHWNKGTLDVVAPGTMDIIATLSNDACAAHIDVSVPGLSEAAASVDIPLEWRLKPWSLVQPTNPPATASCRATLDLGFANGLPVMANQRLTGEAEVDLTATGFRASPRIEGHVSVTNAAYSHDIWGTRFAGIALTLEGRHQHLELTQGAAHDGRGGRVQATGSVQLRPTPLATFNVGLDRFTFIDSDLLSLTLGGSVTGGLNTAGVHLRGDLVVDAAELALDALPPSSPDELTSFDLTATNTLPTKAATKAPARRPVDVDIGIHIPPRVRIRHNMLDTTWQGDVRVRAKGGAPVVTGTIEPRRGHFDFLSRRFQVSEGDVRLDGSWPPIPTLDLYATHSRRDIEAILRVYGRANALNFSLNSTPPYPQDEILTRILFGESVAALSPLQALELAAAAHTLQSGGNSSGILGKTQKRLDVDRLDLTEAGEGGQSQATVVVGKQLSHNFYIEARSAINSRDAGGLQAEYELTPNFTIITDLGANMRSGLSLNWKIDY